MTFQKDPVTITHGCAIERDYLYIASKPDRLDMEDEFSRMFYFDAQDRNMPWRHQDLPHNIYSVCVFSEGSRRMYCALSRQGDVAFTWVGGQRIEHIPGAGLAHGTPPLFGYTISIREIGGDLYVVGSGGQVYRRQNGSWPHIAESLKIENRVPSDTLDPVAWMDLEFRELRDIDGTSENDVYVVGGNGEIFHFDGNDWTPCQSGTRSGLNCVRALSVNDIWICGQDGTLLRGNRTDGFSQVGKTSRDLDFYSLGIAREEVYLAADRGLFKLCSDALVRRVKTGLDPEVTESEAIDVKDGVLWSFGGKDIVSFDGSKWARLTHPDNS
jgi:hypothetical protein